MNTEQARFNMIEQQIRPWDVLDPGVLSLLAVVKREDFVPPAHRSMAFFDTEVPLIHGQYMLAPKLEARMLQARDDSLPRQFLTTINAEWRGIKAGSPLENLSPQAAIDQI